MEQASLSHQTLKNTVYSFLGYVLPIIFSVAITPIVVKKLGVLEYGVLILVNTIMGFLNLMDLGLGMAVLKYASEYHARGELKSLNVLLNSANSIFVIFGLIGLAIFLVIGLFFLPFFHISSSSTSTLWVVFCYGGLVFFFNTVSVAFAYIPRALQRYDILVKISLAYLTTFNVAMLVLVLFGYKLKAIMLLNVSLTIIVYWVYRYWALKLLPSFNPALAWNSTEIRKSYRFGIAAFLTNISNNALAQLDRLIIPVYLNPAQLSYYSLPGNIAEKINGVTGTSTGVLFPMVSAMSSVENREKLAVIYNRIFRNIMVLVAAMGIPVILLSQQILTYWLGMEFALNGSRVLVILTLTNMVLAVYSVLQNFLLGYGKVRFLMKASFTMAAINIMALLLLLPRYKIYGAAWAYLISVLPILWIFGWIEKKTLLLQNRIRFYLLLFGKIIVVAAASGLVIDVIIIPQVTSLYRVIIFGPISVTIFILFYVFFGFVPKEDWQLFKSFALRIKNKLFYKHALP